MRLTPVLAALGLGVACAYAQLAPPADQARRLPQAQSLRDKAWGAWFAGVSHDPALREPLLAQLRVAQSLRDPEGDPEGYAYIQALFDSLIQIPGPIPTDVILPFEASWRAQVLILLSRNPGGPENESNLLAMREESMPDPEWAAVNDLLFSVPSKAFFQRTLQEIRITHALEVVEREVGFCGGTTACGSSTRRFPKGFPPVSLYQLQAEMAPGDALPVDQLGWRSTTTAASWSPPMARLSGTNANRAPSPLSCGRLGWRGSSPQSTGSRYSRRSSCSTRRPLSSGTERPRRQPEMEGLLARQAASIQTLVGHAQQRELVQASGMRLSIKTTMEDVRRDRSVPAPAQRRARLSSGSG